MTNDMVKINRCHKYACLAWSLCGLLMCSDVSSMLVIGSAKLRAYAITLYEGR